MFNREKLASQLGSHIKYCLHQTLCLGITSADQVSYRGPKAATDGGGWLNQAGVSRGEASRTKQ